MHRVRLQHAPKTEEHPTDVAPVAREKPKRLCPIQREGWPPTNINSSQAGPPPLRAGPLSAPSQPYAPSRPPNGTYPTCCSGAGAQASPPASRRHLGPPGGTTSPGQTADPRGRVVTHSHVRADSTNKRSTAAGLPAAAQIHQPSRPLITGGARRPAGACPRSARK